MNSMTRLKAEQIRITEKLNEIKSTVSFNKIEIHITYYEKTN